MGLFLVGLGLSDEKDITVKGLDIVRVADWVYLETYTSILSIEKARLESFYGRPIIDADRDMVESDCDELLQQATSKNVVMLVVGDPMSATTHTDLYMRALQKGIEVEVIHNASILNSIGSTGLQLYRFGEVVSIPYFDKPGVPSSFFDKFSRNFEADLHTLCLLDIKVKERTVENIINGLSIYEPPRFMSVNEAIGQIIYIINDRICSHTADTPTGKQNCSALSDNLRCIGVARIGSRTQTIRSGTLQELKNEDFGGPLHSLVLCGKTLHEVEQQFFDFFGRSSRATKLQIN